MASVTARREHRIKDSWEREDLWKEFQRRTHPSNTATHQFTSGIEWELFHALLTHNSHALIAADSDGEDSAGRQKLRLQEPHALVSRCAAIAELAAGLGRLRGWIQERTIEDANAEFDQFCEAELARRREAEA